VAAIEQVLDRDATELAVVERVLVRIHREVAVEQRRLARDSGASLALHERSEHLVAMLERVADRARKHARGPCDQLRAEAACDHVAAER
jgi:hypothetical protein